MPPNASRPPKAPSAVNTAYLVLYNFVSAVLWATVLGRTALIAGIRSPALVHIGVSSFVRWTQTLAAAEILHSVLGTRVGFLKTNCPLHADSLGIVRTPFVPTLYKS